MTPEPVLAALVCFVAETPAAGIAAPVRAHAALVVADLEIADVRQLTGTLRDLAVCSASAS